MRRLDPRARRVAGIRSPAIEAHTAELLDALSRALRRAPRTSRRAHVARRLRADGSLLRAPLSRRGAGPAAARARAARLPLDRAHEPSRSDGAGRLASRTTRSPPTLRPLLELVGRDAMPVRPRHACAPSSAGPTRARPTRRAAARGRLPSRPAPRRRVPALHEPVHAVDGCSARSTPTRARGRRRAARRPRRSPAPGCEALLAYAPRHRVGKRALQARARGLRGRMTVEPSASRSGDAPGDLVQDPVWPMLPSMPVSAETRPRRSSIASCPGWRSIGACWRRPSTRPSRCSSG